MVRMTASLLPLTAKFAGKFSCLIPDYRCASHSVRLWGGSILVSCTRDFCKFLSYAQQADRYFVNNLKMNLLSAEAKVLAVLINENECMMKNVPNIAKISDRNCYNVINNLIESGIVNKKTNTKDKRSQVVEIVYDELCEIVCKNLS